MDARTLTAALPPRPQAGQIYDLSAPWEVETGAPRRLWMVVEAESAWPDGWVICRSIPRRCIDRLPARHFVPEKLTKLTRAERDALRKETP